MKASVIIPTFNRREIVQRVIQDLLLQDFPSSEYEIIVVADGSQDGTAETLKAIGTPCRLTVLEQVNKGPAAARNAGAAAASGEIVIFLDDDMLPSRQFVRAHWDAHADGGPPAIAYGAIFLSPDSPRGIAAECFNQEIGSYFLARRENPDLPWPEGVCIVGNSSLPRQALMDAGGFDERFRKREDAELAVRLLAAGIRERYAAPAVAFQYYTKRPSDLLSDAVGFGAGDALFARIHPDCLPAQAAGIARKPRWQRRFWEVLARHSALPAMLLTPWWWLGEELFPVAAIRRLGVRALRLHRALLWYKTFLDCGASLAGRETG